MNSKSDRVGRGVGMTSARTRNRLVERLTDQGIAHPEVLRSIASVPRHVFVDEALASRAYEDIALPIGHGQTISQPFIVALMTQALVQNGTPERVLEIGTGCGYQTAILSRLCDHVFSVERILALHRQARDRLYDLGISNVSCKYGDGWQGWIEHAPYDGILVAAAAATVPDDLLQQLAVGGRLIVPVGKRSHQTLLKIERTAKGFEQSELEAVRFVPLITGMA